MILLRVPTNLCENPLQRHRKLTQFLNKQRKEDHARNGHHDGHSGDWQTIHAVDDTRLKWEITMTPTEARVHAYEKVEKRESIAYFVNHPKRGLEIHLWGLAAD